MPPPVTEVPSAQAHPPRSPHHAAPAHARVLWVIRGPIHLLFSRTRRTGSSRREGDDETKVFSLGDSGSRRLHLRGRSRIRWAGNLATSGCRLLLC